MTDSLFFALRFIAALGAAMMAGLYFAFSNTIMSSLAKLEPAQGIAAMQSINRTIQNPLFFLLFVGTAASCALLLVFSLGKLPATSAILMVSGAVIYLVGSLVVTGVFNIPLNNTLEVLAPNASGSADWCGARGVTSRARDWLDWIERMSDLFAEGVSLHRV